MTNSSDSSGAKSLAQSILAKAKGGAETKSEEPKAREEKKSSNPLSGLISQALGPAKQTDPNQGDGTSTPSPPPTSLEEKPGEEPRERDEEPSGISHLDPESLSFDDLLHLLEQSTSGKERFTLCQHLLASSDPRAQVFAQSLLPANNSGEYRLLAAAQLLESSGGSDDIRDIVEEILRSPPSTYCFTMTLMLLRTYWPATSFVELEKLWTTQRVAIEHIPDLLDTMEILDTQRTCELGVKHIQHYCTEPNELEDEVFEAFCEIFMRQQYLPALAGLKALSKRLHQEPEAQEDWQDIFFLIQDCLSTLESTPAPE